MHSPPVVPALEFKFLGGFDVRLNGCLVTGIAYNKMRALLAYLAVEREQDHQREVLADLLWRSNDPVTARGNLRRTLSDLRRVLESATGTVMFSATKHTLRFIPAGFVDVVAFAKTPSVLRADDDSDLAQEERIMALYQGEFLAGLSLPDSPDFENWLQIQRETLRRRALALLEKLSNHYAKIGDYSQSLPFALRYLELEPLDDEACLRVMHLYALNGQHSAALGQYQACCHLLEKELGVLPSEKTRELAERIRTGTLNRVLPTMARFPVELRQVSVLSCELTVAAMDDPEEAMALLGVPQSRCLAIIGQFSGHRVQTHGGGLLAYFGYPQAQEDAARRAVQAALAMTFEAVHGTEIRTGVHTGLILTSAEPAMPDAVGKTSKLAVQICHHAQPGEVVISQLTHDLVAGYFDCLGLDVPHFAGVAQGLELFKVRRESGALTRLEAAGSFTPLVGRQAEITHLMRLWQDATQGVRRVLLIQGEAGLGKSRLLHAMKEQLAGKPHSIRELRCFPEFSQSPFHPLIALFESIFGLTPGDTPQRKFSKLATYLEAQWPASAHESIPLLTQLLSLPLDAPYRVPGFSPQKQKEQTIATVLGMLQTLATQQPVLLIVEDLHWIDPSTLDLLTRFIEQPGSGPVLLLLTARPEFVPPWQEVHALTLALTPLGANEVATMVASLHQSMPAATLQSIVERADGVPLFVEEMTKIATLDQSARIPATLHDLLAARIDHMGEAKTTAQLAACLGREFDLALLGKISPDGPAALAHTLHALKASGLILNVSAATGQFKHALIQEAAYQSQTKAVRQAAHQRIAQALQRYFPALVSSQPELLAQHFFAAGQTQEAIHYGLQAGQRAAQNSANTEAIEHVTTALQRLTTLPLCAERDPLEFALQLQLGATLTATKGYGSLEAGAAYARALTLGEQLDDRPGLFKAIWGMWLGSSSRVGHGHSLELAKKLQHLARQDTDPLQRQQAHYAMGNSLLWLGQLSEARHHQEQVMALYQPSQHDAMVRELGENMGVSTGAQLTWVLWLLGYPDQARAMGERVLILAREVHHPYSQCYALAHIMVLHRWLRQFERTRQWAQETQGLAQEHGFALWLLSGHIFQGWAVSMQGQATDVTQLRQGVDRVRAVMSGIEAFFLAPLGEMYRQSGQFEDALLVANEALDLMHAKDDRFVESEMLRLKGACLLHMPETHAAEAEVCFNQALVISQKQGAKSLELRVAMSLARLWQQQNKPAKARRLLAQIYAEFTEGFETSDLQEARELLAALG